MQAGSFGLVLILPRRDVGEIRAGLEERSEGVDYEEDDEDVVEIEPALTGLLPLGIASISTEGVPAL